MNIVRILRLPEDQYFQEAYPKQQIYLHHTVGGSAKSTFEWWLKDPGRIGTAYIIDKDGTINEVFPPQYWAHHLGLNHPDNRSANELSIGIEIASEGALIKKEDSKLYAFNGKREFKDKFVDLGKKWRGYRYFDAYAKEQIASAVGLINILCEKYQIPKCLIGGDKFRYDIELLSFRGVLLHCNVRADKSDLNPSFPMDKIFQ